MNALNQKILIELMHNSRTPNTQIAKKVQSSREVVDYRIKQLIKKNIIRGFITEINTEKLGFLNSSLFLSIKSKAEEKLIKYIQECDFASWSSEFSGVWNYGIEIYGKNYLEIDENFQKIYKEFKEDIIDHRLSIHKTKESFFEKFLEIKKTFTTKKEIDYKIDSKDKTILQELAKNSKTDILKITKKIKLTAPATAKRIRKLEKSNYIKKYSIFVDPQDLGLIHYSIFIKNKNIDDKEKLKAHLKEHEKISFLLEYVGDPFIEFGIITKKPYELRQILQEIEESFPDNRITEVFMIQKEILSLGPPKCVFE
ncbi:MAG: AsnC family transcriptional regulator [Nanoarchaeota archaeon]|nr:AsnC family transcriptional regulator [Nanoarchaeota archaeon]MBU1854689.1 AsnC family transcriptional regulator [Nanoarchaeota archaeon]